jgi:riboflavin biosynthesis pyrimidine reductase
VYRAVASRLGACGQQGAAGGAKLALRTPKRMSRRAALRRRALRIALSSPQRTPLTVRVTTTGTPPVTVARRRVTVSGSRTVSVPLTRAGARLLRSRRVLRVIVRAGDERRVATIR